MTPAEYRDALNRLGFRRGVDLGRELLRLGDERPVRTVMRMTQWLNDEDRQTNMPWAMAVIVRLLERERATEEQNEALREELAVMVRENGEMERMLVAAASANPDVTINLAAVAAERRKTRTLREQNRALKAQLATLARDNHDLRRRSHTEPEPARQAG